MAKSLLYAVNTAEQPISVGESINFGNAVRRYGCNIDANGGSPSITGTGYYTIDANVNFETDTGVSGVATISLYKDGSPIAGALSSVTVSALSSYNVSIPAIVRDRCCGTSTITAVVSGVAVNVTSSAIRIVKE